MSPFPVETIPALLRVPGVRAFFFTRIPDINLAVPREEAMATLRPIHQRLLEHDCRTHHSFVTAEQIHGNTVGVVTGPTPDCFPNADGLVTDRRGLTLGIYVADCAPVWIVAKDGSAGGLVHSGRKGTELAITTNGIRALEQLTRKPASEFILVIGPCIRPPCYEVDFAAEIRRQAASAGIMEIHDAGTCTACNPERYYSYRREKGLTGRMLATLTLLP